MNRSVVSKGTIGAEMNDTQRTFVSFVFIVYNLIIEKKYCLILTVLRKFSYTVYNVSGVVSMNYKTCNV